MPTDAKVPKGIFQWLREVKKKNDFFSKNLDTKFKKKTIAIMFMMIFVRKVESGKFSIQFFFRDPKLGKSGSSGPGQFGDISPFQGHVGSTDVNGSPFRKHTEVVSLVGFARTVLVSFVLEIEICISFHQPR